MKKMMYMMLGVLLLVPAMAMAQEKVDSARTSYREGNSVSVKIEKIEESVKLKNMNPVLVSALETVSQSNRMFGNAYKVVLREVFQKGGVSFEALDLLGMSFNSLRDPSDVKTAGESNNQVNKRYKRYIIGMLDKMFAGMDVPLNKLAAQVELENSPRKLVNTELFEQLDGTFFDKTKQVSEQTK